jgi:hypothetical protein
MEVSRDAREGLRAKGGRCALLDETVLDAGLCEACDAASQAFVVAVVAAGGGIIAEV